VGLSQFDESLEREDLAGAIGGSTSILDCRDGRAHWKQIRFLGRRIGLRCKQCSNGKRQP
jgi:hypothetical protein